MRSTSPVRTPKLQLAAEESLTGEYWIPPKKDILFIIGEWNAKVESQEIPGVTGNFGLGVQNEAGQR